VNATTMESALESALARAQAAAANLVDAADDEDDLESTLLEQLVRFEDAAPAGQERWSG
jgi:hypothetical protein